MFTTLFLKEIRETIQTYRFLVATVLCLSLLPLGMFVTTKSYESRLEQYRDADRLYHQRAEGKLYRNFRAEGYRPPSWKSVFSGGLELYFPTKVVTSPDGRYEIVDDAGIPNPHSLLFGKVDYHFIVGFILSLLALIYTFSTVSGEKETGTLRLILSNHVSRWKVITAKIFGSFVVFLMPFLVALIFTLLLFSFRSSIALFTGDSPAVLLVIFAATLLFMAALFCLGALVSSLTYRSLTSMVTLLLIWVVFVLAIPKLSPMIAESMYPIKSPQVVQMEKELARENLYKELDTRRRELFERIMSDHGADYSGISWPPQTEGAKRAYEQYDNEVVSLEKEYETQTTSALDRIEQDYEMKRRIQENIAVNLSRLSPLSCFTYIVTELSGTGLLELRNIQDRARLFQQQVNEAVYDNYITKLYGNTTGNTSSSTSSADGYDPATTPVPHLTGYRHVTLVRALETVWVDIVLLTLYGILFFTGASVSFLRYDVR